MLLQTATMLGAVVCVCSSWRGDRQQLWYELFSGVDALNAGHVLFESAGSSCVQGA
jgi:hypothetical protein